MVDRLQSVCCMCGDVGFPDKLFRCNKCRNRFQHSYCSNYYGECAEPIELCDWCRSEESTIASTTRHSGGVSSKKSSASASRSEYSGDKIKIKQHNDHHQQTRDQEMGGGSGEKAAASKNNGSPVPSPRTATRRYKLLKDVMCERLDV